MKKVLVISGHTDLATSVANKTILDTIGQYLPETEIALVRGDVNNIKLTYPADKERVEQLIEETKQS